MAVGLLAQDIDRCRDILLAVAPAMPKQEELERELADATAAQARGYYEPDEDERLREVFARALELRSALRDVVAAMEPWVDKGETLTPTDRLRVFTIGFTAACFLVRTGSFIITIASGKRIVRRKLDEAEPRFRIPRRSFTDLYRAQSSVRRMWKFHDAYRFYQKSRAESEALTSDPELGDIARLLIAEEPFMEKRRSVYVGHRFRYRWHSFRRRHRSGFEQSMFRIFELGGRTIAELRDPSQGLRRQPKRVTPEIVEAARAELQGGDIIVTRHRDALSNVFLPGFWPHAALYVGDQKGEGEVVEARKDGVRLRHLDDTLTVDQFVVLRPSVEPTIAQEACARALSHVGKLYDFAFDFRQSDRLACTAVVYRSWHGLGGFHYQLGEKAGRMCLTAEQLLAQTLAEERSQVLAYYGPENEVLLTLAPAAKAFAQAKPKP